VLSANQRLCFRQIPYFKPKQKFDEYENIVNDRLYSYFDLKREIEEQSLKIELPNGIPAFVKPFKGMNEQNYDVMAWMLMSDLRPGMVLDFAVSKSDIDDNDPEIQATMTYVKKNYESITKRK